MGVAPDRAITTEPGRNTAPATLSERGSSPTPREPSARTGQHVGHHEVFPPLLVRQTPAMLQPGANPLTVVVSAGLTR